MPSSNPHLTAIAKATEEFLDLIRNKSSIDPDQIIDRFAKDNPSIANQINDLFPALLGIENLANSNLGKTEQESHEQFPEISDYEIIREIGRGGMGIVYEARQKSLNRQVALKTLSLDVERNEAFLQRFQREAKTAAALHHSNIVPVYDVGHEGNIHFFSMQYIDGINLAEICKINQEIQTKTRSRIPNSNETPDPFHITKDLQTANTSVNPSEFASGTDAVSSLIIGPFDGNERGTVQFTEVARIGAQVAEALDYIHQRGVIHRDIKPANILLDGNQNAWLADWGLVRDELSELTQTGDLFGSLPYMAPERFEGRADATSDIYSLGVTLYELVTMRRLFNVEHQAELVAKIVKETPPKPTQVNSKISRDFENVIMKAIEKDPTSRYQSAALFADDLRNVFYGKPVVARRLSLFEKSVRWTKSNPTIAILSGLIFVLLVAGTIVSSVYAYQASRAKLMAETSSRQSEESLDVFFGTFFPRSAPDEGAKMAPEIKLALDKCVDRIRADDGYDAVVVGKLFTKLGWIYFNLQEYERALSVFGHANHRVSLHYGEDHPTAMMALDHVGMTHMRLGNWNQSELALIKSWTLQSKHLGKDHENTIHSLAKLGDLYQYMGRFEESIKITKEVMEIRGRPNRKDSQFVLVSMNGLANAYIQFEKEDQAIKLLESVIKTKEKSKKIDLGFSTNLFNLARAYRFKGDIAKASELVERCLKIRREQLTESSDSVISARAMQAGLLAESGEGVKALNLLEQLVAETRNIKLPVRKAMVELELGLCYQRLGNHSEAKEQLTKAYTNLKTLLTEKNRYARVAAAALEKLDN